MQQQEQVPRFWSFAARLYRPYFDLLPSPPEAPLPCFGLEFGIRGLMEDRSYPRIQSVISSSFRNVLIQQTGLTQFLIDDPRELPNVLRSERWEFLCSSLDHFRSLPQSSQVRVGWLLVKLCLYQPILSLIPEDISEYISKNGELASLAYLRALTRYILNLEDITQDYSLKEFEKIAREAPPGIARIDASYQMVVQNVKHHANRQAVEEWLPLQFRAIQDSRTELDDFTYSLVTSRYHRVAGFLPQMHQDRIGTRAAMDLAEQFARQMPARDEPESIAAKEILYPVLESRTKEAMWLGDLDLAEDRAKELTRLSPCDPRAWLHLGQVLIEQEKIADALVAYKMSTRFSPPGREIAWFMAAQCLEALGDLEAACDAYIATLEVDPLGISAAEQLVTVANQIGANSVFRWATGHVEYLRRRQITDPPPVRPEPYKYFPPPIEPNAKRAEA